MMGEESRETWPHEALCSQANVSSKKLGLL